MARRGRRRRSTHLDPEPVVSPWRTTDQRDRRGRLVRRADIGLERAPGGGVWRVKRSDPLRRLSLSAGQFEAAERWRETFELSGFAPLTTPGIGGGKRPAGARSFEPGRGPLAPEYLEAKHRLSSPPEGGRLVCAITTAVVLEFHDLGAAARDHGLRRTHPSSNGRGPDAWSCLQSGLDVLVGWHRGQAPRRRT